MKLFQHLLAYKNPGRRPGVEPVPFQEYLPLKLRQRVSGKGDNLKETTCLQELSDMLTCFKANEYNETYCSKEIKLFQDCYTTSTKEKNLRREMAVKGTLVPGEKNLSAKQVNVLLRRYPNIK